MFTKYQKRKPSNENHKRDEYSFVRLNKRFSDKTFMLTEKIFFIIFIFINVDASLFTSFELKWKDF